MNGEDTISKNQTFTPGAQPTQRQQKTLDFVAGKKKDMKESQYRKRFDQLCDEIDANLVNTVVSYGQKLYEHSGWGSVMTYTKTATGNTDMNVYPQKLSGRDQNRSGVPVAQEPIAFSKIITAASVLGGKLPDAQVFSDSKIYSKVAHDLWKKTWRHRFGNGQNTQMLTFQNLFTYGWAAWRIYPKRVQVTRNGVPKIIFDDVYREPLDPRRTWLGFGSNAGDTFSRFEVYYEKDMPIDQFLEMYPSAKDSQDQLQYTFGVSEESKNEDNDNQKNMVTIGYYENMLLNRFVIICGQHVIYDGEMPNDDSYGSVIVANCFIKNIHDPYGVGLYEMMRGNTAIYTYLNSLNAQQVEAEIFPILFGSQVQNGTATYKRGPNVVNPKTPGTTIDVVKTSANLAAGVNFADKQKQNIEDNTGVNNIIAGSSSENTLGSTVILKEAAQNRLVIPRNSMVDGLGLDALICNSWIKQTYSVDKVFMFNTDEHLEEFRMQNPDYFIEAQPIVGEGDDVFKGYAVVASPYVRLSFDFEPKDDGTMDLMENVPERRISQKALFDQLAFHKQISPSIDFVIDPNSMLLPSMEIQKQQYAEIYPVIQNSITIIFSLRMTDPAAAASQLLALETFLDEYNRDIYDYVPKSTYDEIVQMQPPVAQMAMMGMMGGQPMTPDGTRPGQPQAPQEIKRPQGPLGSSIDASVGYAASLPMTPNK